MASAPPWAFSLPPGDNAKTPVFENGKMAYTKTLRSNPSSLAGLDYTNCTTSELQHFIKQRTPSETPVRLPSDRIQLLWQLIQLDRKMTFRFQDMMPELRLLVFEELFASSRNMAELPQPQVLSTCRVMYREAKPILLRSLGIDPIERKLVFDVLMQNLVHLKRTVLLRRTHWSLPRKITRLKLEINTRNGSRSCAQRPRIIGG